MRGADKGMTLRIVNHWPDALFNLGWCLFSIGYLAAHENVLSPRSATEAEEASDPRRIRERFAAMQHYSRILADMLPQPTAWRMEGTPEEVESAWQHLQSIGMRQQGKVEP
jgi:hypothetical protein